jgi:nitrate reductase NapAB chaperone NapD
VTPHPDGLKAVRAAIGRESDLEYRGEENGQLIVVSESVFGAGLDDVAQRLTSIPGVVALALVAAFDEDEETA